MQQSKLIQLNTPLTQQYIDFKAKQVIKGKDSYFAQILAYKDARVDMDRLDAVCGVGHWQNEFKRDSKGILQGGIGVFVDEINQWVWKWSNGTPSDFESEKGEYSDALKRAGFMWGIGRMLYEFPKVFISLNENEFYEKDGKVKISNYFKPNEWEWDINEDYTKVVAYQKYGNSKTKRFDSNPYKK